MNRYSFQYYSRTLASLAGRKEQQIGSLTGWAFDFPSLEVRIALSDGVKKATDTNLHTGQNIIVDLKASSEEEARETSKDFAETLLNLISFATLAYCHPAKLLSITTIGDGEPYQFRYYTYPFADHEILGSLSIVDETIFRTVFDAYIKSPNQHETLRALTWLRKGIGEENAVDEFVSYWVGLEAVKHLLRDNLRMKMRKPKEWDGVEDIFTNKLHLQNFGSIKNSARNKLLHGRKMDNKFVKEIDTCVEPIRKTLIHCIATTLGLEDSFALTIANKTPRRIRRDPWTVIEGDLRNLPTDWSELVRDYPTIDAEIEAKQFSIDEEGNLSMRLPVTYHFRGPKDANWEVKAAELWVDKDAAIKQVRQVKTHLRLGSTFSGPP